MQFQSSARLVPLDQISTLLDKTTVLYVLQDNIVMLMGLMRRQATAVQDSIVQAVLLCLFQQNTW